jgi:hypothetical protein
VPPVDGVTVVMPVNHGIASAVSPEADGNYKDEPRRACVSPEDEKKRRADSPAVSDYML